MDVRNLLGPLIDTSRTLWSFLWILVAIHYGKAAFISWRVSGGEWKHSVSEFLQPFWWAIRETLCQYGLFRSKDFCTLAPSVPILYPEGQTLRFSIFLGSLTPVILGVLYLNRPYSKIDLFTATLNFVFTSTSIMAAGGHLFLAYRHTPEKWRQLVMICLGWIILGPFVFAGARRLAGL